MLSPSYKKYLKNRHLVFFLFLAISFCVYFNSINNNFLLDDHQIIENNSYIKNIKLLPKIFTANIYNFASDKETDYFRPVQVLSYALDYAFFGLKPFGYHLTSIILHAINCFLIYLLILILFNKSGLAFSGAVLYCVWPGHSSVVSYISGRADILVSIFMLLSMISFFDYTKHRRIKSYFLTIIFFVLALFSRENSLILPLFILLLWFITKSEDRRVKFLVSSFFVIAASYYLIRVYTKSFTPFWFSDVPIGFTLVNFIVIFEKYINLFIYPWPLYLMRTTPFVKYLGITDIIFLLCLTFFVIVLIFKDKKRIATFGFIWFLLAFLPVAKLMYFFSGRFATMAENWLYFPSIGFFVLAAYLLSNHKMISRITIIMVLIYYGSLTILNNKNFRDDSVLYAHILKFSPDNTAIHMNLANLYYSKGDLEKSLNELAIVMSKEQAWDSYLLLGNIYLSRGNLEDAIESYKKAIELKPNCAPAYNNLGIIYQAQDKGEDSFKALTKAIQIDPEYYNANVLLGDWFVAKNLHKDALTYYNQALELNPKDLYLHLKIGVSYAMSGDFYKAEGAFLKALKLNPKSIDALKNIGALYANFGDFRRALECWDKALYIDPLNKEIKENIMKLKTKTERLEAE